MQHPDVQERVQEELDTVLGNRATASLDEKTRLPFTCAVILEISRKASLVPVIGHTTTVNCEFEGYKIPAGTIVMGNLIGIHHDERFWTKPDVFDPDRFFDKDNNACLNSPNLVPFSVGKRYCLGQSLAEKELFLFFFTWMMKRRLQAKLGSVQYTSRFFMC